MTTLQSIRLNKWLASILLVTVALTLWTFFQASEPEVDLIELVDKPVAPLTKNISKKSKHTITSNADIGIIAWQKLKRTPLKDGVQDPFKVHSWLVAPPVKKTKPPPTALPVAPIAPFIYIGKYDEDVNNVQFFLQANGKLYSTLKGENINQEWRLDGEDASNLQLTYLPLNLTQVLSKTTRATIPIETPVTAEMNL